MPKFLRVYCWGLLISFLGTLPMGTLNVTAMQIGIQESIQNAFYFSLGCLLVEMSYVRLSLIGISWIRKQEKIMRVMEWLTLGIVLALAFGSFYAALQENPEAKNAILHNNMHRFLLGMMLCAINPVQIPFWFGWSTVLFSKSILQAEKIQYNLYILGIGTGTIIGHALFILGGSWVVSKISNSTDYINWVIGGFFSITAIVQLIKIIRHKGVEEKISKIEDELEAELHKNA